MLLAPCIGPGWVCRGVQSLDESGSPRKPATARGTNVPWVRWYIRAVCTVCEPVLLSRSRFRIGLVAAPSSVEPTHTSYPSPPSHPPSDVSVLFLAPDMQTGGASPAGLWVPGPSLSPCALVDFKRDRHHAWWVRRVVHRSRACEWCVLRGSPFPFQPARRGRLIFAPSLIFWCGLLILPKACPSRRSLALPHRQICRPGRVISFSFLYIPVLVSVGTRFFGISHPFPSFRAISSFSTPTVDCIPPTPDDVSARYLMRS